LKNYPGLYTYLYIAVAWVMSHLCDPMIKHFNKRGIFTAYYTANEESDIRSIL